MAATLGSAKQYNVMIAVPQVSNILLDSVIATLKVQTAVFKYKSDVGHMPWDQF